MRKLLEAQIDNGYDRDKPPLWQALFAGLLGLIIGILAALVWRALS